MAGTCMFQRNTVRWTAGQVLVVRSQRSALGNVLLQTERARSSCPEMIMGDRVKMQSSEQSAQDKARLLASLDIGGMHLHLHLHLRHRVDHYRTVGNDCGS